MRNVEILAPAGSYEGLVGAINGGCDAVYLGGSKFGARAYAKNLDEETMLRAIDYVHLHDKKIYLTVNTLLDNEEIEEELFEYLEKYYMQGLDAVIVQDPGVIAFIHRNFPELPIHASTQMTFTSECGGKIFAPYGVTRFVPARELSIEELRKIRQQTDLEMETFVHGALCYCYSGQCFLSSMLGNRSGNRGRCAQPCRKPYKVQNTDGKKISGAPYVLSPKDMCTLDKIPDLVEAGIDSFKIEGRMKKPGYAAFTAHLYRKYVDLYLEYQEDYYRYIEKHKKELEYDYTCLADLYNRGGFCSGYYYDYNGKRLMSMSRPNHYGVKVATVDKMKKNRAVLSLEKDIYAQDVLEFRREDGKVLYEYTVKEDVGRRDRVTETNTKPGSNILPGTSVYRTRRNALLQKIEGDILENYRRLPVDFYFQAIVGKPMELTCVQKEHSVTVRGDVVQAAKSQPMSKEKIQKNLSKLNQTNFKLENCNITMEQDVFIPVGQLNEIRREAIKAMEQDIIRDFYREHPKKRLLSKEKMQDTTWQLALAVTVSTREQAEEAKKCEYVRELYMDLAVWEEKDLLVFFDKTEKDVYLILPSILRKKDYNKYKDALDEVSGTKESDESSLLGKILTHRTVKGFLIKNYEGYILYKDYISKKREYDCVLDYNMYVFNREARAFWQEQGIWRSTASVELNGAKWRENGVRDQDLLVYGRLPFMTSVQCVVKNTKGCQKKSDTVILTDADAHKFYGKSRCKYCYNQIYGEEPLSLHLYAEELLELKPYRFRLDFMEESREETKEILQFYIKRLQGEENKCPIEAFSTGHYRKGVK